MKILRGKVVSGIGNFSYWMEKLKDHYYQKTGVYLFPGTLNIQLNEPYHMPPSAMQLVKEEYLGTVTVNIVPCKIENLQAFILRTEANEQGTGHHPKTIIEIAADVKLRDALELTDGDTVNIEID